MYLEHSSGIDGDRGRHYAAGDYYRILPDGALVLHGGTLGLSKRAFKTIGDAESTGSASNVMTEIEKSYGPVDAQIREWLRIWVEHRETHPISSPGDHFFLDQRRACWGSDNRFAEDIFGFEWVLFANCWRLVDLFMSASTDARDGLLVQKAAIHIMTPHLTDAIPEVNPPMTQFEVLRGRFSQRGLHKLLRRVKKFFRATQ
jgi:hypothetical protein